MTELSIDRIIDLSRYPLDRADSEDYRALTIARHDELDSQQYCTLPGFLQEGARREIVAAVEGRQQHTNRADGERNIYLERNRSEALADDHPKNIFARGCYNMMGAHLLEDDSALKVLYYWAPMQRFIADIVGATMLYPSADPYQPVNVLCQGNGDRSSWHFDSNNAFTMTLMLQAPESGGHFEMAADMRSDTDPNYKEVSKLLLGDTARVLQVSRSEGELVIFRGCNSAHRVTPVAGNRLRLMCIMVYETRPGVIGDPVVNETVYGIKNLT